MKQNLFSRAWGASAARRAAAALFAGAALVAAPGASAALLTWSLTGPGTTSASQTGNATTLNYSLTGPDVYSTNTWTATTTADESGAYDFNWNYRGFHAYFMVTAFLDANSASSSTSLVNAGPANCCTTPSNSFNYTGDYTFANVNAGDVLSFTFGGSNIDSTAVLQGTLALTQVAAAVPEPASLALLGLGLAGLVASRRRARLM